MAIAEERSIRLSGIRDVVCGLRKDLYSRYSVVVLKAFIDDSGSDEQSPWYVLAGYLGTVEGWDSFDEQWTEVLHAHPYIEYFKASEAESLRSDGQWAGVTKPERDAKIDALINVIGRCTRRAICTRMRRSVYNELVKSFIPPLWDQPYYFLMPSIIGAGINIERIDGDCEPVDFVFDADDSHKKKVNQLVPTLFDMQSYYGSLVNVTRRDEKTFLPLQAADLLAWQIRRYFSVTGESPRRHYERACNAPPKEFHSFIMDRSKVSFAINEIRAEAERLAASLGRSPDVTTWT